VAGILSTNTAGGGAHICVKCMAVSLTVDALKPMPFDSITDTLNRPRMMPLGLIGFKLTVENPGDTFQVMINLSRAAARDAKWYNYDIMNGWHDDSSHATVSANGKTV